MAHKVPGVMAAAVALAALAGCGKPADTARVAIEPSAVAPPVEVPKPRRKAGLWEHTTRFGQVAQATRICLDAASDEMLGWEGAPKGNNPCSENVVTMRAGGGWMFSSSCDMGEMGQVASHGTATGDFASQYRVEVQSTTTGAKAAQMNGTRTFTVEATWKGPCPAGMKPGDIELPSGVRFSSLKAKDK